MNRQTQSYSPNFRRNTNTQQQREGSNNGRSSSKSGCFLALFKCLSGKKGRSEQNDTGTAPGQQRSNSHSGAIHAGDGQGGTGAPAQARGGDHVASNSSAFDQFVMSRANSMQSRVSNAPLSGHQRRGDGFGLNDQEVAEQQRMYNELQQENAKALKERNKVRVQTEILKKDVEWLDTYPDQDNEEDREMRKVYKYYCPICLRYFNHILVSSCCQNYICRLCIGWQAKKAKKDPNYKIVCSHCYAEEFRLKDVVLENEDQLKYYTDTPFKCLQRSIARNEQCSHQPSGVCPGGSQSGESGQVRDFLMTPRQGHRRNSYITKSRPLRSNSQTKFGAARRILEDDEGNFEFHLRPDTNLRQAPVQSHMVRRQPSISNSIMNHPPISGSESSHDHHVVPSQATSQKFIRILSKVNLDTKGPRLVDSSDDTLVLPQIQDAVVLRERTEGEGPEEMQHNLLQISKLSALNRASSNLSQSNELVFPVNSNEVSAVRPATELQNESRVQMPMHASRPSSSALSKKQQLPQIIADLRKSRSSRMRASQSSSKKASDHVDTERTNRAHQVKNGIIKAQSIQVLDQQQLPSRKMTQAPIQSQEMIQASKHVETRNATQIIPAEAFKVIKNEKTESALLAIEPIVPNKSDRDFIFNSVERRRKKKVDRSEMQTTDPKTVQISDDKNYKMQAVIKNNYIQSTDKKTPSSKFDQFRLYNTSLKKSFLQNTSAKKTNQVVPSQGTSPIRQFGQQDGEHPDMTTAHPFHIRNEDFQLQKVYEENEGPKDIEGSQGQIMQLKKSQVKFTRLRKDVSERYEKKADAEKENDVDVFDDFRFGKQVVMSPVSLKKTKVLKIPMEKVNLAENNQQQKEDPVRPKGGLRG